MYALYMEYTIAEFKKHTRRILDEALTQPIYITRYDQRFKLFIHSGTADVQINGKDITMVIDPEHPKDTITMFNKKNLKHTKPDPPQPTKPTAYGKSSIEEAAPLINRENELKRNMFAKTQGKCGHMLNDQNKCTTKKCPLEGKVQ